MRRDFILQVHHLLTRIKQGKTLQLASAKDQLVLLSKRIREKSREREGSLKRNGGLNDH